MEANVLKNEPVFLPPFVVNDYSPPLPQSQTLDWGMNKLSIPTIHAAGFTGKGVKVAVIDTYADPNHPDLVGAIVKTINKTSEPFTVSQNGHGTGCAGIIGARNNATGVLGVAPDCQIIGIKAMRESGSGTLEEIVAGIDAAIAEKVHIINMSLGTTTDVSIMKSAIQRAANAGILVVCSAGNAGQIDSVMWPAKYETAIAVAATNESGNVSAFSSMGWDVDIAAPGERVLTCWRNKSYAKVSGTSFSAPYVSGVLALFLEAQLFVNHDRLGETAIDIEETGKDMKSGYGLINPNGFITKYYEPAPPSDPFGKIKEANAHITEAKKLLEEFLNQ